MSNRLWRWLNRGLGCAYGFFLYAMFVVVAPGRPAYGQDCNDFDVASGDNPVANSTEFDLLGKKFKFARNIVALLLLAAVYAFRSRVSWQRWQGRRAALKRPPLAREAVERVRRAAR